MFRGSVYCRRWLHQGKRCKAWGIRYRVNGGEPIRRIVADTRDGALAELDRLKEDHQRGLLGVAKRKTLTALAPLFLAHKANQGRAMEPITVRVESNLLPHFGGMALEEIQAEAIDEYIHQRKAGGVENSTINRDLAVLRHMLRLAVLKWRWLRQEPYIEMLPENGPRELELTETEEAKLRPVCSGALWTIIQAAIFTGMREGELLALTWPQVDLAGRVIDFPPTKRGRKRLMPIAEPLYDVLARLKAGPDHSNGQAPTDRVFLRPDGRPWSKWTLEAHFKKALIAAAIATPLRFHDLRHTCASRLLRLGVHEMEIQQLLGHKTLQTTRGYITIRTEELRRAVNRLQSTQTTQQRGSEITLSNNAL